MRSKWSVFIRERLRSMLSSMICADQARPLAPPVTWPHLVARMNSPRRWLTVRPTSSSLIS